MLTVKERFEESYIPEPNSGCWLWLKYLDDEGYGRFGKDYKQYAAHRASYEIFRQPIPKNLQVLHKCDTPSCVNPSHLFIGTHADNMKDCHKKGRYSKQPKQQKLTDEDRVIIKNVPHYPGINQRLARDFGVSRQLIMRLRSF